MPEDFQPGAAPDQWVGGPSGEGNLSTDIPLTAGSIIVDSVAPSAVSLSATEATGGAPSYSHQWQRGVTPIGPWVNLGTDALTLQDTGLAPSTVYYYQLIYTDQLGVTVLASQTVTTPEGLGIVVHPDYVVTWEPSSTQYFLGEKRPLKFTITRSDNGLVDIPSDGKIAVTAPDGTVTELAPDMGSGVPSPQAVAAQDYLFDQTGTVKVKLLLTIDNQIVGGEALLFVSP